MLSRLSFLLGCLVTLSSFPSSVALNIWAQQFCAFNASRTGVASEWPRCLWNEKMAWLQDSLGGTNLPLTWESLLVLGIVFTIVNKIPWGATCGLLGRLCCKKQEHRKCLEHMQSFHSHAAHSESAEHVESFAVPQEEHEAHFHRLNSEAESIPDSDHDHEVFQDQAAAHIADDPVVSLSPETSTTPFREPSPPQHTHETSGDLHEAQPEQPVDAHSPRDLEATPSVGFASEVITPLPSYVIVGLDAVPGAGKSTLASALMEKLEEAGYVPHICFEDVESDGWADMLKLYYRDSPSYDLLVQVLFQIKRFLDLQRIEPMLRASTYDHPEYADRRHVIIVDRTPYGNMAIDATCRQRIRKDPRMREWWSTVNKVVSAMTNKEDRVFDMVYHLQVSPDEVMKRIVRRGREFEQNTLTSKVIEKQNKKLTQILGFFRMNPDTNAEGPGVPAIDPHVNVTESPLNASVQEMCDDLMGNIEDLFRMIEDDMNRSQSPKSPIPKEITVHEEAYQMQETSTME